MGLFAAVDLGSRSFHLTVARVHGENTEVVDRVKEPVRLAAGIRNKAIEPATWGRAEAALARIGERIRDIPHGQARAVGTNAFRQVKNRKALLGKAATALGHRVEVISGAEEARLIYLGVSHLLPEENGRRLVVDIGGGSTELVIGQSHEPLRAASLYMGCVSYTRVSSRAASSRNRPSRPQKPRSAANSKPWRRGSSDSAGRAPSGPREPCWPPRSS